MKEGTATVGLSQKTFDDVKLKIAAVETQSKADMAGKAELMRARIEEKKRGNVCTTQAVKNTDDQKIIREKLPIFNPFDSVSPDRGADEEIKFTITNDGRIDTCRATPPRRADLRRDEHIDVATLSSAAAARPTPPRRNRSLPTDSRIPAILNSIKQGLSSTSTLNLNIDPVRPVTPTRPPKRSNLKASLINGVDITPETMAGTPLGVVNVQSQASASSAQKPPAATIPRPTFGGRHLHQDSVIDSTISIPDDVSPSTRARIERSLKHLEELPTSPRPVKRATEVFNRSDFEKAIHRGTSPTIFRQGMRRVNKRYSANDIPFRCIDWDDTRQLLKAVGDRTIKLRCHEEGKVDDKPPGEHECFEKEMSFKQFLGIIVEDRERFASNRGTGDEWMYWAYNHFEEIFNTKDRKELKGLIHDICDFGMLFFELEDYKPIGKPALWLGTGQSSTPCHRDSYGFNLVAQCFGAKRWNLAPPTAELRPCRFPLDDSTIWSHDRPQDFPADFYQADITDGDFLFVPHSWWHECMAAGPCLSINQWQKHPQDGQARRSERLAMAVGQIIGKGCASKDGSEDGWYMAQASDEIEFEASDHLDKLTNEYLRPLLRNDDYELDQEDMNSMRRALLNSMTHPDVIAAARQVMLTSMNDVDERIYQKQQKKENEREKRASSTRYSIGERLDNLLDFHPEPQPAGQRPEKSVPQPSPAASQEPPSFFADEEHSDSD